MKDMKRLVPTLLLAAPRRRAGRESDFVLEGP